MSDYVDDATLTAYALDLQGELTVRSRGYHLRHISGIVLPLTYDECQPLFLLPPYGIRQATDNLVRKDFALEELTEREVRYLQGVQNFLKEHWKVRYNGFVRKIMRPQVVPKMKAAGLSPTLIHRFQERGEYDVFSKREHIAGKEIGEIPLQAFVDAETSGNYQSGHKSFYRSLK